MADKRLLEIDYSTPPALNDVVKYDGAKWVPGPGGGGGGGLSNGYVAINGTSGSSSASGAATLAFASTNGVTTVATDGSPDTVTIDTPQDIRATASPSFLALNIAPAKDWTSESFDLFDYGSDPLVNYTGAPNTVSWSHTNFRLLFKGGILSAPNDFVDVGVGEVFCRDITASGLATPAVITGNIVTASSLDGELQSTTGLQWNGVSNAFDVTGTIRCTKGLKGGYLEISGAHTLGYDDFIVNCTSGTFSIALPAIIGGTSGQVWAIVNSGAGVVTLDPNLSNTIQGSLTKVLNAGEGVIITNDGGSNWPILSEIKVGGGGGLTHPQVLARGLGA